MKLIFNSFKIKNHFSYKDPISNDFKSFLVYIFTCASCSSSYIGETCRHFKTGIEKHIKKDNKSKHQHSTTTSFGSYNPCYFNIIDKANSKFDLKTKETLHINWRKLNLNAQQNRLSLPLLLQFLPRPPLFFPVFVFFSGFCFIFAFLFPLLFSLSLTLMISIFYCLNYTWLLLHLITTHFVSHLSISSILFIICTLIIGIFYCLHYTSLLLHLFITHLVIEFMINM